MFKKHLRSDSARLPGPQVGTDMGEGTGGQQNTVLAVEATVGAMRSARGQMIEEESALPEVSERKVQVQVGDGATLSLDSVALEVRGVLDCMRALAMRSAEASVSAEERGVIQDEFSMMQARHALITTSCSRSGLGGQYDLGRTDSLMRLTPKSLGVDGSSASVGTAEDAEWALVRIDGAERAVQMFRDECGTVEERIDAALERLADFVEGFSPASARRGRATDIFEAAERIRLLIMQEAGIDMVGQSSHLPKGVSPLLQ